MNIETDTPAPEAQAPPEGKVMHLPAKFLPPGVKEGDVLKINVTGPADEEGDFPVQVQGQNQSPEEGDSWESGLREALSPQAGEEAA
jgi:hypothetical protein